MSPQHHSDPLPDESHAAAKLDRLFAALFLVQWLAAIAFVWTRRSSSSDDLFTAIVIGASIATVPTTLIVWKPGSAATRHAVAVAQMLYGTLVVHLTAGKLGTPYHVFASLTFLALYRDWRVVGTAVGVTLFDTVGVGCLSGEIDPARWLSYLGWVAFAATCLAVAAHRAAGELRSTRQQKARLEALLAHMSSEIRRPTIVPAFAPPPRISYAANDLIESPSDSTKIVAHVDAVGSAPTLRPAPMCTVATAHEQAIHSDLEGDDDLQELLESFVQRLRETSVELDATTDHGTILRIANRLQGAASSYGFASIAAACGAVEEAIPARRDVTNQVAHLTSLCRRARARRLISARAA